MLSMKKEEYEIGDFAFPVVNVSKPVTKWHARSTAIVMRQIDFSLKDHCQDIISFFRVSFHVERLPNGLTLPHSPALLSYLHIIFWCQIVS